MRVVHLKVNQTGATLILMAFIIALAATVYLLKTYDPAQLRLEQDKKTYLALNEAKQALIAYAVSNSLHPGQLPYPDRNSDATGYDGKSDCGGSPVANLTLLIGQLPIYGQTAPCSETIGLGINSVDATGNRLWYAVSPHLIRSHSPSLDPIINPSILNNQWLKVVDRNGVPISDRVAAVIIAPGNPIGTQSRTALAPASEFLDTFKIGPKTYSNADYTKLDEDFILGEDSRNVSNDDTTFIKPYYFNDKLVYITIDELMVALERRAATEAANFLKQYKKKTGQWPYAANLVASKDLAGNLQHNHKSQLGQQKGMLPIDERDYCSCESLQKCKCSFYAIKNVTMTTIAPNSNWITSSGACVSSGNKCTCTDAGSCSTGSVDFVCDTLGVCNTTQTGLNSFIYEMAEEPSYEGACNRSNPIQPWNGKVTCNDLGGFSVGWFKNNFWQDYFYYEWLLTPPYLQVGTKNGIRVLLIATGQALDTQHRPPANLGPIFLSDYLDSVENTNGDNKFDSTTQQKSSNYNDQTFILEP